MEAVKKREGTMNMFATVMISAACLVGTMVSAGYGQYSQVLPTTTLASSIVEAIDSTGLNITVKAAGGGETLSMMVVSPEILKGVTVGDRVSLELDLQGRVVKILKLTPVSKEAPEPRG